MLKKYKILLLMIVISLLGIIGVISVWLYGSFTNHRDMLVIDVERSLFNSVQSYYVDHQDSLDDKRKSHFAEEGNEFLRMLKKT